MLTFALEFFLGIGTPFEAAVTVQSYFGFMMAVILGLGLMFELPAVILLLASANRDPDQFEQADRFDIARYPNPHLSFGRSRHACVGGSLVRLELQAALATLADLLPELELATSELAWEARMGHRWLGELMVRRRGPTI